MTTTYPVGSIISTDLTIPNTEAVRNFYRDVIGWTPEGLDMSDDAGAYQDYVMKDDTGNWVGGVCYPRGANADLPPVWLVYINVADVAASLAKCEELGGTVLKRAMNDDGTVQYGVIQDPAGAILAVTKAG